MTVINTNVKSLVAQDAISRNNVALSTSMQRLSTGSRINSAKDDAAGLAISTRMTSQVRGLNMAVRNANDGISLMQTSEGALEEVTSILQRMRELAVQSVNGTNNNSDRVALNDEVSQLKTEIDRIAKTTQFNNQAVLDGSFAGKKLQIGDKAGQTLSVDIASVKTSDLGMTQGSMNSQSLISARVSLATAIAAGDIQINNQSLAAITSTNDLGDVVNNINLNVDNVKASGFNTAVARNIGDGITTNGQLSITVQNIGNTATTSTTYSIAASSNMQQLVANINAQAGAQVTASINKDNKLVLSNSTGATISVLDTTQGVGNYSTASGFQGGVTAGNAVAFAGFLQLDSKDGSPIRITNGNLGSTSPGVDSEIAALGFRKNISKFANGQDSYTLVGGAIDATSASTAWDQNAIQINGVNIYNSNISTATFQGKLDAINNFADQTGVVAYANLESTIILTAGNLAGLDTAGTQVKINGVTAFSLASAATATTAGAIAAAINNVTTATGITATVQGLNIKLTGTNVSTMKIEEAAAGGTAKTAGQIFTISSITTYAGLRLDSVKNTPISISLGDSIASAGQVGLFEQNVGAADFQVNAPSIVGGFGSTLGGLNVSSQESATAAITSIDNALEKVSSIRSKLGAMENRLNSAVENLTSISTNTSASRSRILDTDYATETTALARSQIISQAATAMLAQANQQGQSVLSLLK